MRTAATLSLVASCLVLAALCPSPAIAGCTPGVNHISLAGELTHVDVENEFAVVTAAGLDILIPCAAALCGQLTYGDQVEVDAHFGPAHEVCGGLELHDNPIVVDELRLCKAGECTPLTPN